LTDDMYTRHGYLVTVPNEMSIFNVVKNFASICTLFFSKKGSPSL